MFFRSRQKKLDEAFLKAVGNFDLKKIKKLLAKGADVFTVDAENNTALHRLAAARVAWHMYDRRVDEIACFLLAKNLGINTLNKQGKSCLHLAAENKDDAYFRWLPETLINRGADPNMADPEGKTPLHFIASRVDFDRTDKLIAFGAKVNLKDNSGRTPLHIAASAGHASFIDLCLKTDPSLIAMQDNEGKYPHESAIESPPGHYAISMQLLQKFNAYSDSIQKAQERKMAIGAPVPSVKKPVAPVSNDNWYLLKPDQAAHVSIEKAIGYKLTEIFNFRARTYTMIMHNLETRHDAPETKSFDDFSDKAMFLEARKELIRLGGQVDENLIYGRVLDKSQPKQSPHN